MRPVAALLCLAACLPAGSVFVEKPYIQLGDRPRLEKREHLTVAWHAADREAKWTVEYRRHDHKKWRKADVSLRRRVEMAPIEPHRIYAAELRKLDPGQSYAYRVRLNGNPVFESTALARKSAAMPYRFVVFGDCGQNTPAQKKVAYQTYRAKPDFVAITGDIVYGRGRISEYRLKYFPIYNSDEDSAALGAPLIRSTLFVSSPGNHDVGGSDLAQNPDGLAYFLYWAQPLNGPSLPRMDPRTPQALGSEEQTRPFLKAAANQYPRMASFSFDYGNSHWTVLDSNRYADWSSPEMSAWLKNDLAAARSARWRFVIFHHPGINSSKAHFNDQWMRLLAPVFEEGKVDIVFAGHVHNYQRSHPLRFAPAGELAWRGIVDGRFTLDKSYDGEKNTSPKGVIYVITGAGGAGLYNPEQEAVPTTWQDFTSRFKSNVNSFTLADVDGGRMTIRQVDANGKELDKFTISK